MSCFLGIDVGVTGAIGRLEFSASGEQRARVEDMPVFSVRKGKTQRRVYDLPILWDRLRTLQVGGVTLVVLEDQWAFKGQGVTACFSLGRGLGVIEAFLTAAGLPYQKVAPITWKTYFGLRGTDKGRAREVAARLFPAMDFGKRKDEGRAEAMLLATYAARLHDGATQKAS